MRILQKVENAYEPEGIAHLQNCTRVWQKAFVCLFSFVFLSNCSRFSPKRYFRPGYPISNPKRKLQLLEKGHRQVKV